MEYEWDDRKDTVNRGKHGLALADGIPALEDPNAEAWIEWNGEAKEERTSTIGLNGLRVLFVVTTERGENRTRIISVRKAERHEERWYHQGRP
jgi:uncharacterized protein